MHPIINGLTEAALTVTYNTILTLRRIGRQLVRPTTVGVRMLAVHPTDGRILLVRHRGGTHPWSLPGGGVDRYEPLAAAAIRELREEAGCTAHSATLLGMYYAFGEGMSNHVAVFTCTPQDAPTPPRYNLEIIDVRWFAPSDLPATTEAGSLRRIGEWHRGECGIYTAW
jgi:8-oxo-dGTP pyrophosphatase MutT (NUDIX family)